MLALGSAALAGAGTAVIMMVMMFMVMIVVMMMLTVVIMMMVMFVVMMFVHRMGPPLSFLHYYIENGPVCQNIYAGKWKQSDSDLHSGYSML
jgi:hypothetical protein